MFVPSYTSRLASRQGRTGPADHYDITLVHTTSPRFSSGGFECTKEVNATARAHIAGRECDADPSHGLRRPARSILVIKAEPNNAANAVHPDFFLFLQRRVNRQSAFPQPSM